MTKRTLHIALYSASLLFLSVSCQKEHPQSADNRISFRVYTPLDIATKAEVTDESIKNTAVSSVYVYESSQSLFGTSGSLLTPETNEREYSGRWLPEGQPSWGEDTWNRDYQFWGWAYSPRTGGLTISDAGKTVTVTQPSTYPSDGEYVDYLLSYIHSEPALSNSSDKRKSIPLVFEHALVMVDIYLYRALSMTDKSVDLVVNELTLGKIYNEGRISCNSHSYNSTNQQPNVWSVQSKSGSVDYSIKNIQDDAIKTRDDAIASAPAMRFISIPVTNSDMLPNERYKLKVSYTVTVTNTTGARETNSYTEVFQLSAVTASWQSGHRVKYELCISSGIELTGSIADWIDVEYVEGVVLPNTNKTLSK